MLNFVVSILPNKFAVVRFDEIDSNGDRQITINELKNWHKQNEIGRSDYELKEMIASHDQNNDQMLNIAEFVPLLLSRKSLNHNQLIFNV